MPKFAPFATFQYNLDKACPKTLKKQSPLPCGKSSVDFTRGFNMDVYEAITSRRSITRFKPDPIPKETLEKILNAALWAPSKLDLQNWYFVVLGGKSKKDFSLMLQAEFTRLLTSAQASPLFKAWATEWFLQALEQAPILVLAFSDRPISEDLDYALSVAAAVQNLMLAAWDEGIGTRWFTSGLQAVKESIYSHLGLKDKELIGLIVMGYPEEIPQPTLRRGGRIEWRIGT